MPSLLGRLLPLFTGPRRVEDLFTEAVARLFERRSELCLAWLEDAGLVSPVGGGEQRRVRVETQPSFVRIEEHESDSRPDMILDVRYVPEDEEAEGWTETVMVESKIGSSEGADQLERYAGQLGGLYADRKTLVYITRNYDPKDASEIEAVANGIEFRQLRWHDFYRFLQTAGNTDKDALTGEVMAFMEEQGMSRSHRFSVSDLMALSGVPRAFEVFDETLGDEVKRELESFAGRKVRREAHTLWEIRTHLRYQIRGLLHEHDLLCDVGHQLDKVGDSAHASILRLQGEGYPAAWVSLEARPNAVGREASLSVMERMASRKDWESYNLDNPSGWAGVRRVRSLASFLPEEDHVAAVKRFFVESIGQLREELTEFKKENPDLPWSGGETG